MRARPCQTSCRRREDLCQRPGGRGCSSRGAARDDGLGVSAEVADDPCGASSRRPGCSPSRLATARCRRSAFGPSRRHVSSVATTAAPLVRSPAPSRGSAFPVSYPSSAADTRPPNPGRRCVRVGFVRSREGGVSSSLSACARRRPGNRAGDRSRVVNRVATRLPANGATSRFVAARARRPVVGAVDLAAARMTSCS